jgi:hypothetical protein
MKKINLSIISRHYSYTRNEGRADKSNAIGYSRRTDGTRRTRRTRCVTEKLVGYSCCHAQEAPAAQADPTTNTRTGTYQQDIQADQQDLAVLEDPEDQEDQADPADQVSQCT